MKKRVSWLMLALGLVAAVVGLLLFLNLTNPSSVGPLGILLVFVLIYAATFLALLLVVRLLAVIICAIRPVRETAVGQEKSRILQKRITFGVAALSFVPIFLISLNSIGQLKFVDVILIVAIEAVAMFYISRRV